MKIISARVIVTCPGRNFVTLKIETSEGVYGIGDATLNGREKAVVSYLEDHVIPCLIGMDPRNSEDIWQYLYRGASLPLSHFQDCYTALTPSRMAADLAYPMSILCGFLPLSAAYEPRRRMALALLALAAVTASAVTWKEQGRTDVYPEYEEAGRWLRAHSAPDSLIIGSLPQLEYLSWRETSMPPLPSSEPRNDASVLWKRDRRSFDEWISWGQFNRRPVYFIVPVDAPRVPALREVFNNRRVRILTPEWNANHEHQPRHRS